MLAVAPEPEAAGRAPVLAERAQPNAPACPSTRPTRPSQRRLRLLAELAAAVTLGSLVLWRLGLTSDALSALYLAAVSPALVVVDLAEHRLPDRMTLPGLPIAILGIALGGVQGADPGAPLAAGGLGLGLFLLLHTAGGMGLGDVKLALVLALALGVRSWDTVAAAAIVAFLAGGAVSAVVLARRGAGTRIPFGPFLLIGFWVGLLLAGPSA
jgi:leader peptidase (prepilin peptidase)/N-methyltransferase